MLNHRLRGIAGSRRGRIYPSRGTHARQITGGLQVLVGDGFIRPEVCTLVNSGRATSRDCHRSSIRDG
ncbi:MAG: hypothetical protein FWG87_12030 [Defluviitaleaceae bacterium]|nr:hypothetical protein [Defluviitaleaceae bacterium]